MELVASSAAAHGRASLLVALDAGKMAWVEYPLPTLDDGQQRHVLRIRAAFYRAVLTREEPMRHVHATLTRLPVARLALMAAQRSPGEVVRAAWWWVAGKKVRARNRFLRLLGPLPCFDFRGWVAAKQRDWEPELAEIDARMAAGPRPRVVVCVDAGAGGLIAAETEESIRAQSYPDWTLATVADAAELNAVLRRADDGGWLVHIANGERLVPDALLRIAGEIAARPSAALVYWDDTEMRGDGLIRAPRLKPDWNPDLQWAQGYVGSAAVPCAQALAVGGADEGAGPAAWFDLVVRVAQAVGAEGVRHVPHVLSHRPAEAVDGAEARAACVARLTGADAGLDKGGHVRVTWPVPAPAPLVSLIVPTRDRLDLLQPCVEGLLHRTDYPALEVLIADNGSRERRTRAYLEAIGRNERVRVVPCPGAFNFAAINNRAAVLARGSVLGFINNDIEVMEPGWLTEMVGHALRAGVGAVGAKLLYPSGLVQHAGVIVGLDGLAGHAHRFYPAGHPGYMDRLQCAQVFSAVTAACLVMRRDVFAEAGGFDETVFPVAYNDVDLCLRLGVRGLKTVWTPYAVLRHKETATRERDYTPARLAQYQRESTAFRQRWERVIAHDPHYHPLLTRADESFFP
ncbi:MAG: glycosyltransferase family 2 protein [Hyphomicrobiaceae bacterium]